MFPYGSRWMAKKSSPAQARPNSVGAMDLARRVAQSIKPVADKAITPLHVGAGMRPGLKLTETFSPDRGTRAVRPPIEGGPDETSTVTASPARIATAQDLGDLVREERELRKLSQQAFADLVGVGRRFISELENGKATLEFDKVVGVASAIGIDLVARKR